MTLKGIRQEIADIRADIVTLVKQREEVLAAIREWSEADRALMAHFETTQPYEPSEELVQRRDRAEARLRELAGEPVEVVS